jgi:deazaflavin-dependent oxidoreductase (nitroreductase family)
MGRRTGEPLVTPTLYLRDGDRVVLPESFGGRSDHPAWYRNLKVNPQVAVQIHSEHLELVARDATDEERDRYWLQLIRMYLPYKGYRDATDRRSRWWCANRAGRRHTAPPPRAQTRPVSPTVAATAVTA